MDPHHESRATQSESGNGAASSSIQQRRERGRAAQAAFRKRQIDTIRNQEEQIRSLSRALEMVNQTRYQLKTAITMFKALECGSIPIQLADDFLQQLERANQELPQETLAQENRDSRRDSTSTNSNPGRLDMEKVAYRTKQTSSQHSPQSKTNFATSANHADATAKIYTDAKLGHPVSLDPGSGSASAHDGQTLAPTPLLQSLTITVPPIEMLPYLPYTTNSTQSFAYKLYWAGVSYAYQLIIGTEQQGANSRMFTYHFRHQSVQSIKKKLWARLAIQKSGIVHRDASPHSAPMYAELILQDMVNNGEDVQRYLCPSDVELYFRRKYVDPDNLQSGHTMFMPHQSDESNLSALLVQFLTTRAMCFGDGPKYHLDDVEKAFDIATGGSFARYPALSVEDYPTTSTISV